MGMSDEQRRAYIAGLIEERSAYLANGDKYRAGLVSEELARMGEEGSAPVERAEKRPRSRKTKADSEKR
jgi:hypothetical protein